MVPEVDPRPLERRLCERILSFVSLSLLLVQMQDQMTVSQVVDASDSRPGSELETSGELVNNSDSWAFVPEPLSLQPAS